MKKNLLREEASNSIIERVRNLSVSHRPLWGEMTATEMLLHCNSCNRQILQEDAGKDKSKTTLQQFILRVLALYMAPNFKKISKENPGMRQKEGLTVLILKNKRESLFFLSHYSLSLPDL